MKVKSTENKVKEEMESVAAELGLDTLIIEDMSSEQVWAQIEPIVSFTLDHIEKLKKAKKPKADSSTPVVSKSTGAKKRSNQKASSEDVHSHLAESLIPKVQVSRSPKSLAENDTAGTQEDCERFMAEVEENEEEFNRKYVGDDENWEDDASEPATESPHQEAEEQDMEDNEEDIEEIFDDMRYGINDKNFARLEKKLVEPREWQMKGEVRASQRPVDGLLTTDLEFDRGIEPSFKISPAVSSKIEDIIRSRVKDRLFDDREVILCDKKVINEQSKLRDISTEKDKRGLGDIYEDKYKSQVLGLDSKTGSYKTEEIEMRELFRNVCYCIDQMTRLNYTPVGQISIKAPKGEDPFVIEENTRTIITENVLKSKKDYKDIFKPKGKELLDRNEMTAEEKKSLRRRLKRIKKIHMKKAARINRARSGLNMGEEKLLKRNMSKLQAQISYSKVKPPKFTTMQDSFKNFGQNNQTQ